MNRALSTSFLRWRFALHLVLSCALVAAPTTLPSPAAPQAAAPATPQALTLERIYSAPSLSGRTLRGPSWSPDGKWLTYLDNGSSPQIMAIDAATGQRQVLVDAEDLRDILLPPASRGQQTGLGRYAAPRYLWSPDSKSLLFISAQELFWYDLGTRSSRQVLAAPPKSSGSDAADFSIDDVKISPDGHWVSFVRAHDVWIVGVAGGAPKPVTRGGTEDIRHGELDWVYPEELDLLTAYWWSPDSSRIAFLELDERRVTQYPLVDSESYDGRFELERYPIVGSPNPVPRVGVAAIAGGDPRWMDTGADQSFLLPRVAWLPDSRRVAIERLSRTQNDLSLLFADATTGKATVVLHEQDKYWINLSDDFRFLADGQRFLWSSERSGYRHLYLYDLSGKQLAQLTSGNWQVESVAGVDEKNGAVYFTSTQAGPIERQFYRVSFSGGAPVLLTHTKGSHNVELAPGCGHFLDSYSTATTPPRQDLYDSAGSRVAVVEENKVPELDTYHLQPVEFFTVPGADGTPLNAQIIRPANFDPARRYPAIVYIYGGPQAQVVRDAWQGPDFLWHEMMAQKGFVIFAVDGRGTAGRGHVFETPIYRHFGEAELADLRAGVSWLDKQPYVNPARVGIWGWSFGGYMTCVAMLRAGDLFKAGFAGAPVTDWRQYDTMYTERYMGMPDENADGYRDASPVNFAAGLQGRLLIAHATGDDNVHFANTVELAEKFVEAQKYAEYEIYSGRGHGITDAPARIHLFNRVTQFLVENLAK
jgi:dipeptidyl-peptidase-4